MPVQSDLRFTFTAGADEFDVIEFRLVEALSETFLLEVDLSCASAKVDFGGILDQPALFTIWAGGRAVRLVHGLVSSFQQGDTGFRRTRYRATVEPRLARLKLASDWRIFQALAVPDIAKAVLGKHRITQAYEQWSTESHLPREYCVQAGDSDYTFVERIMREEGFFYGFMHTADGHRLIHCDRLWVFGRADGPPVEYNPMPGGDRPTPALHSFLYTEQVRTARHAQRDYDFKNPRYDQHTERAVEQGAHQSLDYERYDYPGRYKNISGVQFTRDRLRGLRGGACMAVAQGDDARLTPGVSFDLVGHPREDMNRGWRPIRLAHHGKQYTSQAEDSADAEQGTHYHCTATLVPDDVEWRAEPLPKPRIDGPQQATVVGPPGEEIYCDNYGRVKVQFPWDREGKLDEHSSCWIRVSQNVAGALWGHIAIPRIGQEVIVSNFDGDPDQPVITGRSYNAHQLPPYDLPAHKTRMTIKSQTHKGDGFNEMRFEDEAGREEIYLHAQKDQNIHVNNDESTFVGHDRRERVENDEAIVIGHDRTETVGNDERVTVARDRRHDIGQDASLAVGRDHTISIVKDRIEEVGNHRRDKTAANHWTEIGGHLEQRIEGHAHLQAGQEIRNLTKVYKVQVEDEIVLEGPGGSLHINRSGITLSGVAIHLKAPISQQANGGGAFLSLASAPEQGEPICVSCWLKAARERKALMRMGA